MTPRSSRGARENQKPQESYFAFFSSFFSFSSPFSSPFSLRQISFKDFADDGVTSCHSRMPVTYECSGQQVKSLPSVSFPFARHPLSNMTDAARSATVK